MGLCLMSSAWRWTSAVVMGTSHAKTALPCQDFALCNTLNTSAEQVLIAIVSDGAGTAKYARDGARITCLEFMYAAKSFLIENPSVNRIDESTVLDWLDRVASESGTWYRARRDQGSTVLQLYARQANKIGWYHLGPTMANMKP